MLQFKDFKMDISLHMGRRTITLSCYIVDEHPNFLHKNDIAGTHLRCNINKIIWCSPIACWTEPVSIKSSSYCLSITEHMKLPKQTVNIANVASRTVLEYIMCDVHQTMESSATVYKFPLPGNMLCMIYKWKVQWYLSCSFLLCLVLFLAYPNLFGTKRLCRCVVSSLIFIFCPLWETLPS